MSKTFIFFYLIIFVMIAVIATLFLTFDFNQSKYVFDEEIDGILENAGVDPKKLSHLEDLDSYYSKTFNNNDGKKILIVSQLPYLDRYKNEIEVGWEREDDIFVTKENTFHATVIDNSITITTDFDDFMSFSPNLYLGDEKILPKSYTPSLLKVDPLNSYYRNNVLVWDYGICKRYVRIIEGMFLGFWEFEEIPSNDVTIKYNQNGDFRLNIGTYSIDEDTEQVTVEDFNKLEKYGYPIIIGDTLTVYPDSSANTCDGRVYVDDIAYTWDNLHDKTDGSAADTAAVSNSAYISSWGTLNNWGVMSRVFASFDTSSIDPADTISSGTITVYGRAQYNSLGVSPELNVYGSTQADSNTLVVGDFSKGGTLPFSTNITYAGFNFNAAAPAANTFSLNVDGLGYINKGGETDFCFREVNYDVADVAPAWSAWHDLGFTLWSSEQGVGYKPTLVLSYSVPTTEVIFDNPSTDGYVMWDYDANTVWDTVHDADGTSHVNASPAGNWVYPFLQYWTLNGFNGLARGIISYDTSSIPDDATVSSAYLSLYFYAKNDTLGLTPSVVVGTVTLDSTSTLIASDYNYLNYGITSLGSISYAAVTTGTYNTISLNSSGLAAISKTGNTSFSFRLDNDFDDADPGGGFASYAYSNFSIASEEYTAGAYVPKLIVNYTGGSSLPVVVTGTPTSIEETSATGNGNITSAGSGTPSYRGFCWSITDPPTTADSGTQQAWNGSTGTYSMTIDSLTAGTHYYVRAYAISDSGTGYGASDDIYTKPNPVTDLTVDSYSSDSGTLSWSAPAGGLTGYYVRYNTGTYPATYTEGNEWYTGSNITAGKTGLSDGTTYYVSIWSYFTDSPNAGGVADLYDTATFTTDTAIDITTEAPSNIEETTATATGVISSIGSGTPSLRGFCWSTSDPPTILDDEINEVWAGATGTYNMNVTGLTAGTHYYIRAYATDSNETFYGDSENIYTKPNPVTGLEEIFSGPDGTFIKWDTPAGSLTGYYARIKSGSYPADYTDGSAMTVSGTTASVSGLLPDTTYYIRVWSYFTNSPNAGGVADSYDEITVVTEEEYDAVQIVESISYDTGISLSEFEITRYGDTEIYVIATRTVGGGKLYSFDFSGSGTPVFVDSGTFTTDSVQNFGGIVHIPDSEIFAVAGEVNLTDDQEKLYTMRVYPDGTMDDNCLVASSVRTPGSRRVFYTDIQLGPELATGHMVVIGCTRRNASGNGLLDIQTLNINGFGNISGLNTQTWGISSTGPSMGFITELSRGSVLEGTNSIWVACYYAGDADITTFSIHPSSGVITLIDLENPIYNFSIQFGEQAAMVDSINGNIWAFPLLYDGYYHTHTVEVNRLTGVVGNVIDVSKFYNTVTTSYISGIFELVSDGYYGVFSNIGASPKSNAIMNYIDDDGAYTPETAIGPTEIGKILGSMRSVESSGVDSYIVGGISSPNINLYSLYFNTTTIPQMLTYQPTDIDSTSCTGRGYIVSTGGVDPTYRGFVWNLTGTPTTSDYGAYETGTFGTGYYELEVTGFPPNTTIYMRSFATNEIGVGYGSQVEFVSHAYPQVYTLGVTHVGSTTATAYGYITSVGASALNEMGFVYSTSGTPTTSDSKITHLPIVTPVSEWYDDLTGLSGNTHYYIRAFARNSYSTGYGDVIEFNTVPSYNDVTVSFNFGPEYILPPSSPGTIMDTSPYGNNASYILADMIDGITVWTTSFLASGGKFYPGQSDTEIPDKWIVPPQTGMTQQGSASNLPLYDIFEEAGDQLNMEPAILYIMMVLSMAMGIGFLVFLLIGNILVAIIVMIVMLAGFFSTGVMPLWILIFFAAFAIGIIYVSRQT